MALLSGGYLLSSVSDYHQMPIIIIPHVHSKPCLKACHRIRNVTSCKNSISSEDHKLLKDEQVHHQQLNLPDLAHDTVSKHHLLHTSRAIDSFNLEKRVVSLKTSIRAVLMVVAVVLTASGRWCGSLHGSRMRVGSRLAAKKGSSEEAELQRTELVQGDLDGLGSNQLLLIVFIACDATLGLVAGLFIESVLGNSLPVCLVL
ncbi:hypothetical protein PTKIN_Ptkin03bG0082200 [Pterospermum kingtungense]